MGTRHDGGVILMFPIVSKSTQRSSLERERSVMTVNSVSWRGNERCVPGHISFVPVGDLLRLEASDSFFWAGFIASWFVLSPALTSHYTWIDFTCASRQITQSVPHSVKIDATFVPSSVNRGYSRNWTFFSRTLLKTVTKVLTLYLGWYCSEMLSVIYQTAVQTILTHFCQKKCNSTACSHFINNIIIHLISSKCSTIWGKEDVEHWSWNTNKSFQITVCQWKHLHIYTSTHNGRHFWECFLHHKLLSTCQYAHLSLFLLLMSNRKWHLFSPCELCMCALSDQCERIWIPVSTEWKKRERKSVCVQKNKGSLVFEKLREGMPSPCPVKYTGLSFWCPHPL